MWTPACLLRELREMLPLPPGTIGGRRPLAESATGAGHPRRAKEGGAVLCKAQRWSVRPECPFGRCIEAYASRLLGESCEDRAVEPIIARYVGQ